MVKWRNYNMIQNKNSCTSTIEKVIPFIHSLSYTNVDIYIHNPYFTYPFPYQINVFLFWAWEHSMITQQVNISYFLFHILNGI